MSNVRNDDWTVVVGWDDSQAMKGAKRLEKVMGKITKAGSQAKGITQYTKQINEQNKALAKQNTLERARIRLQEAVRKADAMGIKGITKQRGAVASTNVDYVNQNQIELTKKIKNLEHQRRVEKEKSLRVAAQEVGVASKASEEKARAAAREREAARQRVKVQNLSMALDRQRAREEREASREKERQIKRVHALSMSLDRQRRAELRREDALESRRISRQTELSSLGTRASVITGAIPQDTRNPMLIRLREQAAGATEQIRLLGDQLNRATSQSDFSRINQQIKSVRSSMVQAERQFRRTTDEINKHNFAARGLSDSLRNLGRSYISVFAVIAGGRQFYRVGAEMESLQATMLAASDGAVEAGENFDWVRRMSFNLGVSLTEGVRGFTKLGAAGKAAGMELDETKEIFLAATEASRAFGLDSQRTGLVYLAFDQMLSCVTNTGSLTQ